MTFNFTTIPHKHKASVTNHDNCDMYQFVGDAKLVLDGMTDILVTHFEQGQQLTIDLHLSGGCKCSITFRAPHQVTIEDGFQCLSNLIYRFCNAHKQVWDRHLYVTHLIETSDGNFRVCYDT